MLDKKENRKYEEEPLLINNNFDYKVGMEIVQKPKEELPSELEGILLQSFEYITKPRFEAVVSKIGEVNIKDIGKVMGLMTKDILEDMAKDELETPENKKFMKLLQTQVQTFIRPILLVM